MPRMNHKIVVKGFDIRKLSKEIPALLPAAPSYASGWIRLGLLICMMSIFRAILQNGCEI